MRATKANRVKFVQSSVDESLFGERVTAVHEPLDVRTFDPPWEDNGKAKASPSKPLLFYCPTSPSRPTSSRSQTSQASQLRSYKPVKFSPSYVDHSLFGKRKTKRSDSPPPSEFEPPWVKESEKRPVRPLLFDFNSRLVFDNSDVNNANSLAASARSKTPQSSSRSSSRRSSRTQSAGHLEKIINSKPPWRWR